MVSNVLIAATHPLQCTGYARVGATLANGFVDRGLQVAYWGYQNLAPASGRRLHPSINILDVGALTGDPMGFGEDALPETMATLGVDTVILYNDVMVLNRFLDAIDRYVAEHPDYTKPTIVCYVDLVHDDEDPGLVHGIVSRSDRVWVFANHWRDHICRVCGIPETTIDVVPHGVDPTLLEHGDRVSKTEARQLLGIPETAFVVVNTNRNSYRKALDLTIEAFLRFWKTQPTSVLVLNNNGATDSGYDLTHVTVSVCRRLDIQDIDHVLNRVILRFQNGGFIPDPMLAALYVASDVGINTCLGEGFGLCQLEGACLGRPQIATNTGGLRDVLKDEPHILVDPAVHLILPRGFVMHSGTLDIPDPAAMAAALERISHDRPTVDTESIRTRCSWSTILETAIAALTRR